MFLSRSRCSRPPKTDSVGYPSGRVFAELTEIHNELMQNIDSSDRANPRLYVDGEWVDIANIEVTIDKYYDQNDVQIRINLVDGRVRYFNYYNLEAKTIEMLYEMLNLAEEFGDMP